MAQGWISLHRQLQKHWLWEDKPFSKGQAWIDLLMSANHCDRKVLFDNKVIEVKAGSFITSINKLEKRWGWGNRKVSRFLDLLQEDGMIQKKCTTRCTTITIENYTLYQDNSQSDAPLMHHSCTADAPLMHTNNNDNNDNNSNNDNKTNNKRFKPPTVDEVRAYCQERNNGINPEGFVNHYESKGWFIGKNKMKDWKAAVRTWETRQRRNKPTQTTPAASEMTDLDDVF